jgi:hypothetical protein
MDPAAFSSITTLLTQMGLPGMAITGLFLALRYVHKLYTDVQEKRIAEGLDNRTAIERNTTAMTALVEVVKERKG